MTAVNVKAGAGTMAERADIHDLYEEAVQGVEDEIELIQGMFKDIRGRKPKTFREDFCGTASASCQWVRSGPDYNAVGVDIDADTLEWGRQNRVAKLPEVDRARVKLIREDVMAVTTEQVDLVGAFNFSYWIFKTREEMRRYFRRVREALKDDGLFFLDAFGGHEAYMECKEKTKHKGFTYVWHQAKYEPISGNIRCHIDFRFPDKSKIKKAFTYEWRLWTLPELRELLEEAGFSKVRMYWEEADDDGDGTGEFFEDTKGEADPAWIAYIVAEK